LLALGIEVPGDKSRRAGIGRQVLCDVLPPANGGTSVPKPGQLASDQGRTGRDMRNPLRLPVAEGCDEGYNRAATNSQQVITALACGSRSSVGREVQEHMIVKLETILVLVVCASVLGGADDGIIIRRNERSLEQIQRIYSEMPPVRYTAPPGRWKTMRRTRELLAEGGELRVVMLGDSIVNDTSRSCWNLLLEQWHPKCKVVKVTSVRGSTGCWWYKQSGRVGRFVLEHKPHLVIIGGISHRGDIESIREVIRQIRGQSNPDILLMTGAFGDVDPRRQSQWQRISDPNHHSDYRRGLESLAREAGAGFLDMEAAWGRYIRRCGRDLGWFKRDPIHANERGEQIIGRILAAYLSVPADGTTDDRVNPGGFSRVGEKLFGDLFVWTDTCNVYVLRDGEAALLIDLGDGSVLEHLSEIGVKRVEWVLFTHHHREQCQGYARLKGRNVKTAGPEGERALFEHPSTFRKAKPTLGDRFTVYGSSYVRPPIEAIALNRTFGKIDEFKWRAYEFRCIETRGNSPAGMSYLIKRNGRWVAFSGDVMLDGARMHNWFDSEWDYGFASGIYALHNSAALLEGFDPVLLLASHGPAVEEARGQLQQFQQKLRHLERLYLRGYPVNTFAGGDQDRVSVPTSIPEIWQVTDHIFKFKGPDLWPNFAVILADSGRALVVDCGLVGADFLDESIKKMQEKLGLKKIDAAIITHMHGDHILDAPHLRQRWGAQIWTLDRIADKFERPERYNYAAPVQAYGGVDSVQIDRSFKSGESFEWEGYTLTVDWMPGQTEFALCLHGTIDGRKVAFTGDNIFANAADASQTGHEAVVAHNSGILEEGYIYCADYLRRLGPDVIIGGHSFVMDRPEGLIERFGRWATEMREAFASLSTQKDYRYWFDPFWVRAEPYRVKLSPGGSSEILLHVRNFRNSEQKHRIEVHTRPGIVAEPAVVEGILSGASQQAVPLTLKASEDAPAGVWMAALDVTLDRRRYGEWFDFIVRVEGSVEGE
jgi:glyoxylase-like metal-dependent hydrolase (beta-lactamase superfamily II)